MWRAKERAKRRGIVGSIEYVGCRTKLEVRGVPSHHFAVSEVQESRRQQSRHQADPDSTQAELTQPNRIFTTGFYEVKNAYDLGCISST